MLKAKPKKLLERVVEAHLIKKVKALGGMAVKFTSPQRRSVPDRLVLLDKARAGAELGRVLAVYGINTALFDDKTLADQAAGIVAEMVHFQELKATGAKPSPGQLREHARLRALGFVVKVTDNKEDIDEDYSAENSVGQ